MRVVVQRVARASVEVHGETVGAIGPGLLVLAGFREGDGEAELGWMAKKLAALRIFEDDAGKMNRSVVEAGGGMLVVSQFTLYGDAHKGNRPSFIAAAPPAVAIPLYERFCELAGEALGKPVARGRFGAEMHVSLLNHGPVTLTLEREAATRV